MVSTVLLDTNALIWLAVGKNIGHDTKSLIAKSNNVYVSALSILELRIKGSTGKLQAAEKVIASLATMQITVLPLTLEDLDEYQIFDQKNRDPFDNALISTAIKNKVILVTADRSILGLEINGLKTIDARR